LEEGTAVNMDSNNEGPEVIESNEEPELEA
jgi:hypothetical protein